MAKISNADILQTWAALYVGLREISGPQVARAEARAYLLVAVTMYEAIGSRVPAGVFVLKWAHMYVTLRQQGMLPDPAIAEVDAAMREAMDIINATTEYSLASATVPTIPTDLF